jgi:hypothetical protein
MTTPNPITPPPELVDQWSNESPDTVIADLYLATRAAQWGANQELEACCEWTAANFGEQPGLNLRLFRRPKPPSLKQQAKQALGRFNANAHTTADQMQSDFDLLRCAIESLPDNTAPGE